MNARKLNTIMLIDDSEADNFIHQHVLEEMEIADSIVVMDAADRALEYLKEMGNSAIDLIFLDINMPRMNGFEFLEEYNVLNLSNKETIIVVMLTTSVAPEDMTKAEQLKAANYLPKPLTSESTMKIIEEYFS